MFTVLREWESQGESELCLAEREQRRILVIAEGLEAVVSKGGSLSA